MNQASKLPNLGQSIFSVMSQLAKEHQALNLAQGFPDYDADPKLIQLACHYLQKGHNQYAPMTGLPQLLQAIANKIQLTQNASFDPLNEITITNGATQALFAIFAAFIGEKDEVCLIEPAYDSYRPVAELFKAQVISHRIQAPDWNLNWPELKQKINHKTRLLVFNTPHNPTGYCWSEADFQELEQLCQAYPQLLLLSDEVYEHLVFDGQQHRSLVQSPTLRSRSFCTYSFGKTLHATGWKIGYVLADAPLTAELRKIHQFNVFCVNTPLQYAIADYLENPEVYQNLNSFFQTKRDYLVEGLKNTAFKLLPCQGTYFLNLDYTQLSQENDVAYAHHLTKNKGLATIPLSAFYHDQFDQKILRLCFAKRDETLEQALRILQNLT